MRCLLCGDFPRSHWWWFRKWCFELRCLLGWKCPDGMNGCAQHPGWSGQAADDITMTGLLNFGGWRWLGAERDSGTLCLDKEGKEEANVTEKPAGNWLWHASWENFFFCHRSIKMHTIHIAENRLNCKKLSSTYQLFTLRMTIYLANRTETYCHPPPMEMHMAEESKQWLKAHAGERTKAKSRHDGWRTEKCAINTSPTARWVSLSRTMLLERK